MHKTQLLRTLTLLLGTAALLSGCNNIFGGFSSGTSNAPDAGGERPGQVTISVAAVTSQSIVPDVASLIADYEVTLSRSGYSPLTDSGASGPFAFSGVALGTWNVSAEARDASARVIGTGTTTVEVTSDGTGSATVSLVPTTGGSGGLDITISWPAGTVTGLQHATLTPAGQSPGPDISGAFSVGSTSASYTNSSTLSGQYILAVKLEDGSTHVASVIEAVHVYDNVETVGTISLSSGDIAQAPAAPSIESVAETASGSGNVTISWSDNSNVEETYKVWRSTDGGSTWTETWDVGANSISYTDQNLAADTTYTYRVTAENSFGFNQDTATTTTATLSVYYVSEGAGNDGNHGGHNWPVASISEGLSRATTGNEVRVTGGTYTEVVTVNKPVSIYGSYDGTFSSRSLTPPTSVIEAGGNEYSSLRFNEGGGTITNSVVFDGFDVRIGGTRSSSWTEAITINDGAPTISNNRVVGWNGVSSFAAAVGIGSSRGASAQFENNLLIGSYDGPWTVTIKAYGDSSPVFRDNEIYGVLDGGGGGGTDYTYLARPNTSGKLTFINNYMDVGVSTVTSFASLRGLALEGETDADIFGNVITTGESPSTTSAMLPIQIGYNGVDGDNNGTLDPLNVRVYGNTIHTGSGGGNRDGIHVVQSTGTVEIVNNLVVTTTSSGTAYWIRVDDSAIGAPVRFENNALSGPGSYWIDSNSLTTVSELNTAGTSTATTNDPAAGNVIAAPSFTNPAAGDFTLDSNTPSSIGEGGLNLSSMSNFPTTDLGGTSRTAPWSIGAYEFDGPFATGSVAVNITFDDPNDPDVTFSGVADGSSVVQGTSLSLSAGSGYSTYTWYLNGVPADTTGLTASGSTATVTTGDLALGTHALSLVVGDGTNLYSAQISFTVTQ